MPDNFEFAYPWLFLLIPIPLLIYWFLPAIRIRSASLLFPGYENVLNYTGQKPKKSAMIKRRGFVRWMILFISWSLLICAMATPQLVGEPEMKVKTSRNFLILSDISFSMAQKDWEVDNAKVSRWEAVKKLMHEFISKRKGDRMGLIFFGSAAYIQAPFTPDLATVDKMLEEADVGMAGQMTRIGKAIAKGVKMFNQDTIKTKVMLILTDGVDDGMDVLPLDAADLAQKDSVIIYTLGIGNPGTKGSDLDEKTLQEIAEITRGKYFLAKDVAELENVYAELDELEPIEYEERQNRPVTLLYIYPLGASMAILLALALFLSIINLVKNIRKTDTNNVA